MFAIIISEKGGAERRETFDKNEINVGRVQGNDLMLPKGNVSKHHSRLLYRDGRFIVTDLKSTNGTYVNGRKIAQATIVREGDKIYIGDFILRVDTGSAEGEASVEDATGAGHMPPPFAPPPPPMAAAPAPPPVPAAPPPVPQPAPAAPQRPQPAVAAPRAPLPSVAQAPAPRAQPPAVTRDLAAPTSPPDQPTDDAELRGAPAPAAKVPAPPRMPSMANVAPGRSTLALPASPPAQQAPAPAPRSPSVAPPPQPAAPSVAASAPARTVPSSVPSRLPPRESPVQAGRRLALVTLLDRIADVADLSELDAHPVSEGTRASLERLALEQAKAMAADEGLPEGVTVDSLSKDALRELVGLGALSAALDDDDATEIHCSRHDQVLLVKSSGLALADAGFTTDAALGRAIGRLAAQSGEPVAAGETSIVRHLPRGAHMIAFAPPGSQSHALIIRKRRRVEMALEDFVRLGALSRAMANFLEACLFAKTNLLVCGSSASASVGFVAALASSSSPGERVVVAGEEEELNVGPVHALRLRAGIGSDELLHAAARTRPDRWIVSNLASGALTSTLEAVGQGAEGVLAASTAPSLRQGLARLVSQLLLSRPGMSTDAARSCIAEAFDIAIEVHQLSDGRYRVGRIAELAADSATGIATRDVFVADESGEGHVATGITPRVISESAARGQRVDTSAFKKPSR